MLTEILANIAKFLISRQIQSLMNLLMSNFGGALNSFNTPIAPAPSLTQATNAATYGAGSVAGNTGAGGPHYPVNTASIMKNTGMNVTINNTVSDDVQITAQENTVNGRAQLEILVERKVKAMVGSGQLDRPMQQSFGLRRVPS